MEPMESYEQGLVHGHELADEDLDESVKARLAQWQQEKIDRANREIEQAYESRSYAQGVLHGMQYREREN